MLEVQKHIIAHGNNINCVSSLGIKVVEDEHFAILSYSQIDAPKMNPIVQECRGLVLDKHTLGIAAKPFTRFFNYGEAEEVTSKFVWDDVITSYEKMDGSLCIVWYDIYNNKWRFNTRSSFGDSELAFNKSWGEFMKSCFTNEQLRKMDTAYTYVFEFVSPYNKVVRDYKEPAVYLLAMFNGKVELNSYCVDSEADDLKFNRPAKYVFKNLDEVKTFIQKQETNDPTFEGLVLQDVNGMRLKVKSSTYVALHQLKGNGNIFLPKNLIPFILAGETDEVVAYFPEAKGIIEEVETKIESMYKQLHDVWWMCQDYEEQKKFAIYITKENVTPFNSILFKMKNDGVINSEDELKKRFRNSGHLILQVL